MVCGAERERHRASLSSTFLQNGCGGLPASSRGDGAERSGQKRPKPHAGGDGRKAAASCLDILDEYTAAKLSQSSLGDCSSDLDAVKLSSLEELDVPAFQDDITGAALHKICLELKGMHESLKLLCRGQADIHCALEGTTSLVGHAANHARPPSEIVIEERNKKEAETMNGAPPKEAVVEEPAVIKAAKRASRLLAKGSSNGLCVETNQEALHFIHPALQSNGAMERQLSLVVQSSTGNHDDASENGDYKHPAMQKTGSMASIGSIGGLCNVFFDEPAAGHVEPKSPSSVLSKTTPFETNGLCQATQTVPPPRCSSSSGQIQPIDRRHSRRSIRIGPKRSTDDIGPAKSNTCLYSNRLEDEEKHDLFEILQAAEVDKLQESEPTNLLVRWKQLDSDGKEAFIDSVVSVFICMNAVFIGFSMDQAEALPDVIVIGDCIFGVIFCFELLLKLGMRGPRELFVRSRQRGMNIFDALLIVLDVVQLTLSTFFQKESLSIDTQYSSLFRVVRLARLSRVLRLLRRPIFRTLVMMLNGMIGGMNTLIWAMILFLFSIYVISLIAREYLGRMSGEGSEKRMMVQHFHSVPVAMLTTFRCSFGFCESADGSPLFSQLDYAYGPVYSIAHCIFVFIMSIVVFNVISAIFVQSTLDSAIASTSRQKKQRLSDEVLFATRIDVIIRKLMDLSPLHQAPDLLTESIEDVYKLEVTCDVMDQVGRDPEGVRALKDLDLDEEDIEHLPDILDPDHGGSIAVMELIEGIKRLRGDPRRSDIVTVDLMIRSMQRNLDLLIGDVKKLTQARGV
eukprot:TRINITY_DN35003_c0_g2_i1.p1 TRINITY_DN35003_c0_g2~~TRINITY_DN35003_c0_g2_i1.p1  ORF type:complete len:796 (-),score=223.10 TRINITY_DN35003_c0_g2_i1:373-2760(-)